MLNKHLLQLLQLLMLRTVVPLNNYVETVTHHHAKAWSNYYIIKVTVKTFRMSQNIIISNKCFSFKPSIHHAHNYNHE